MDEVNLVKEISVLKLEPGDVLVLRVNQKLDERLCLAIRKNVSEILEKAGKKEFPIAVLQDGMDFDKFTLKGWKDIIISVVEEDIKSGGKIKKALGLKL